MKHIYIACENENLDWKPKEVERFDRMWKVGVPFLTLCKEFKRTQLEMAILIMDRRSKGFIKPRPSGLDGIEFFKEDAI